MIDCIARQEKVMNVERNSLMPQALITSVNYKSEIAEALRILQLNYHSPVIVVVGGADESGEP